MIRDIYVSYLNPQELSVLAGRIAEIVSRDGTDDAFINNVVNVVKKDIELLEDVLQRERTGEFTSLLQEKDAARDAAFMAFRDYVKAVSQRKNSDLGEAGSQLVEVIKKHGWTLYSLGYTEQSAKMKMLIDDLLETEKSNYVKKINAGSWLKDMIETQNDFEMTYNEKVKSHAGKDIPSQKTAKRQLNDHLSVLINCINITKEFAPGQFAGSIKDIDQSVQDIMTTAKARKTRTENTKDEDN